MKRETKVFYWKPNDIFRKMFEGTLEDLKKNYVFTLQEDASKKKLLALTDADIQENDVFVAAEDYKDPFEAFFGQPEYDEDGYRKFSQTDVFLFKAGMEIRWSASGAGFGGVSLFFNHGENQTLSSDTECLTEEFLTSIFRAAAPALAKTVLLRDSWYREKNGLSSLEEDDKEREDIAKKAYTEGE